MADDDFIRQTNEHEMRLKELQALERESRRHFWSSILVGLAVVTVLLGITGAIYLAAHSAHVSDQEINRQNAETTKACLVRGGSWVTLNGEATCLNLGVSNE